MKKSDVLGNRIRELREKKDMTQTDLAKAVGFQSKSAIAKIESGANGTSYSKILKIAEVLDTNPDYLLGSSGNKKRGFGSNFEDKAYSAMHSAAMKSAYGNAGKIIDSIYDAGNLRPEVLDALKTLADYSYDLSPRDLAEIKQYVIEKAKGADTSK